MNEGRTSEPLRKAFGLPRRVRILMERNLAHESPRRRLWREVFETA